MEKLKMNKWDKRALFFGAISFFLIMGGAGSDDAREFATTEERAHLNIPSRATTGAVYGAGILSLAAALACARKSQQMNKQR